MASVDRVVPVLLVCKSGRVSARVGSLKFNDAADPKTQCNPVTTLSSVRVSLIGASSSANGAQWTNPTKVPFGSRDSHHRVAED